MPIIRHWYVDTSRNLAISKKEGADIRPEYLKITYDQAVEINNKGRRWQEVVKNPTVVALHEELNSEPEVPETPNPDAPKKTEDLSDVEKLELLTHWKQLDGFASKLGIDIPEDITTVEGKKEFLRKALADKE